MAYDFIVVGAGSAGSVVAGRLGEAGYRVLLLEAGGRALNPWIHIPIGYPKLFKNPAVNWCYRSQPDSTLNSRTLFQPRGKVLGGTGAINGMIYIRGQAQDFDTWAAEGCEGWDWNNVLPYFKRSEDQERGPSHFHGIGGPMPVSDIRAKHKLGEAFHAASVAVGSPRNTDFNGRTQEGTGYVQTTSRHGRRRTTAQAYLRGKALKHIDLRLHSTVTELEIEDGRAKGVRWWDRAGEHLDFAESEIVLCAGAFNSPQILLRSGIGPQALKNDFGIEINVLVPGVGRNLQDHFGIGLEFKSTGAQTINDIYNKPALGLYNAIYYALLRRGPLADNGNYSNTFTKTKPSMSTPDMMITLMAWLTQSGFKPAPFSGFSIFAEHLRPKARGFVSLSSREVFSQPKINFSFLQHEADQQAILTGLKQARDISRATPLAEMIITELSPGSGVVSDEELLDYCRANGRSMHHAVGTCRMGIDDQSVVDPRLRIHGVDGIRVIDASIMPNIVSGNTYAASIMIGEKGADLILADQKRL